MRDMSTLAATQVAKPKDEQAFERACLVLWRCILNDPNVQLNARRGQEQDGVDIFGFRDQDPARPVGIQCKLKGEGKRVSEKEVRDEVEKALEFKPALKEYFIVTTAADDGELQRVARELTVEKANARRAFMVNVWGWGTLEQHITARPDAANAFDPTYGPHAKQQTELLLQIAGVQAQGTSQIGAVSGQITDLRATLVSAISAADSTVEKNAVEAALDAEIDGYRDLTNEGQPKTAMRMFEALLRRVSNSATGRILFRIKANIGHIHLVLSDDVRAAEWLAQGYGHAPKEPKAIANFALSLILQKKYREAYEFGSNALRSDPTNNWLAGYVFQAAARCPDLPDPLRDMPVSVLGFADVEAAHVDFLRIRNDVAWWPAARKAHASHPDHTYLGLIAADADLDEIGQSEDFRLNSRLAPEVRQRMVSAAQRLRAHWDKRKVSENPQRADGIAACCNLLSAYYGLAETAIALAIAKEAVALVPYDDALLQRAIVAGLEAGDNAFVRSLIDKLPDGPEAILMRFQFSAHTGDWPRLVEIAKLADTAPQNERYAIRTMGRLAALMNDPPNGDRSAQLQEIFDFAREDARSTILVSDFATRWNQTDIADAAYHHAVSLVNIDSHRTSRAMVARTAAGRQDWPTVTRLLDGYVETEKLSFDLSLLLTAFANENPVRQRAMAFFDELPASIRSTALCATAYGYMQSKRGDLVKAEKSFVTALEADPTSLTALIGLLNTYTRQGDRRAAAARETRLKEVNLASLKGAASDKMTLAHFLRDAGLYERAVSLAYETVHQHRNDPEVALLYFGLFMSEQGRRMVPAAEKVAVDTWFAIENGHGERVELLVEDGPDRPADNVYSPAHPLVAPALGLAVGGTFAQRKAVGPDETWRVAEIKHKVLHVLHQTQHFNVRFPNAKGLYYLSIRENDISPILEQVKQYAERTRKIAALYTEQHIPLALMTGLSGGEVVGFAGYLRQHGHDIVTCLGNELELAAAKNSARRPPKEGVVLDLYTAWVAASLKLLDPLKSVFGRLIVPRSVLDAILQMQHDAEGYVGQRSTSVGYRDGTFIRQEFTEKDAREQLRVIEERRSELETRCEVLPVEVPNDASELARAAVDQCGPHVLDAAYLAASDDRLLLSEDLYFRQLAHQACGAKLGIWLQPALATALQYKKMTTDAYAEAVIGLAACRHSHLSLDVAALLAVARVDGTEKMDRFAGVATFIGTKAAEINSHVVVAVSFLEAVWSLDIAELLKEAAAGIIIENLLRYRQHDWRAIVTALRQEFRRNYRAAEYLERWLVGHFMRV
jgi:cellulose synthase operon protein C